MQTLVDLSSVIRDLITAAALIVGGGFAYFKFARGRTFTERLKASVDAELDFSRDLLLVNASAQAANIGLREFHLAREGTALRLFAHRLTEPTSEAREADWEPVGTWRVFEQREVLEPAEEVSEQKIIEAPGGEFSAFLLELSVYSRSGRKWSTTAVVSRAVSVDNG